MKIAVIDETTAGQRIEGLVLDLDVSQTTARAILEERIREEFRRESRHPLVRAHDADRRKVKLNNQCEVAARAVQSGSLIMLLAERQVEDLDAPVALHEGDEVTFIRLVPLIGG
jgi:hypothetical protein